MAKESKQTNKKNYHLFHHFFRHFDHKKYSQIDIAGKDIQVLQDEPHWCRRAIQVEDVMKL